MPDRKLTYEEIKKAFKCCADINDKCSECPLKDKNRESCVGILMSNAFDLINRLQAENKAYAEIIKKQDDEISGLRKDLFKRQNLEESFKKSVKQFDKKLARTVELTKVEAYKECIEKVKAKSKKKTIVYVADTSIQEQEIGWLEIQEAALDNLLKELVGEGGYDIENDTFTVHFRRRGYKAVGECM